MYRTILLSAVLIGIGPATVQRTLPIVEANSTVVRSAVSVAPVRQAVARPTVKADKEYEIGKKIELVVEGVPSDITDAQYLWSIRPTCEWVRQGNILYVWAKPGTYDVTLTTGWIDKSGKLKLDQANSTFKVIGKVEPLPPGPGPKPPDPPGPGPKPPDPEPVDPAPIKAPGFRVLILYESSKLKQLPKEQYNILYAKEVQDWLTTNTTKDAENPKGSAYMWDANAYTDDVFAKAKTPKYWIDAYKRPRQSLPWLLISNGNTGYDGPLPATVAETIALLNKFKNLKRGDN